MIVQQIMTPNSPRIHDNFSFAAPVVVAAAATAAAVDTKRANVIMELLSTEQNFLESLMIVRDLFINPIRDSKLLDQSEIETIFINWNDLIVCSVRLCK